MSVKLTYELAQTIRDRFAAGTPGKVLAFEYGVSKGNISMIINGKIWTCRGSDLEGLQSSSELKQTATALTGNASANAAQRAG